jgi:hypothetical protein
MESFVITGRAEEVFKLIALKAQEEKRKEERE